MTPGITTDYLRPCGASQDKPMCGRRKGRKRKWTWAAELTNTGFTLSPDFLLLEILCVCLSHWVGFSVSRRWKHSDCNTIDLKSLGHQETRAAVEGRAGSLWVKQTKKTKQNTPLWLLTPEKGFRPGQEQGHKEKCSWWTHTFSNSLNKLGPGNQPRGSDGASFQKY